MTHKLRKKAYNVQGVQDSALNASFGREVTVQQVAPGRHSATDCKPRLDTRRKSMKIATWNVRTLYQEGKIENVIKEMDRMNLNIVGLAETRWTGAAVAKVDNKVLIFSGGSTHERGVGILFDESIEKSLKSWCPVSDRVVVAKFAGKPLDMGIVQVYAPTSTAEEEEFEQFYEDLDKAMKCLKSQDIKIIMGDFNAKAFDKVKHEKLFEMLNQLYTDGKDLRVLRNLYWDQTAAVRVDGELSKIEGTRSRGRQRITFLDSLSSFVTGNNKDNIALLRMTEDRDRWRIMIADVCSRQGI
ncbi:hypothetical protein RRG08_028701 [Elysia crispata]|uniref:Endonuclease/exonuclease/phosphatase domain-containing protein n=1 Tax=Elysia crispata TaxID=231223 RepID=A0AAE0XNE8_9GAST|nr:hypothetical protein RRG08_028701 [Elysia crispata]